MIHVPRANWVLVALADGSVLAYNDNISNHYHYSYQSAQTPVLELLPNRVYTGNGIPIHCMAALLLKKPQGNEPQPETGADSSEDSDERNSPCDEFVCEVWCGQERGRITILDGEELHKICTKSAEDSEPDSSSQREHSVSHLETCQTTGSTISGDDPVGRSVWVALFPGTRVFRWDALEKKIVRSVDCSQHPPRFEGKSVISSLRSSHFLPSPLISSPLLSFPPPSCHFLSSPPIFSPLLSFSPLSSHFLPSSLISSPLLSFSPLFSHFFPSCLIFSALLPFSPLSSHFLRSPLISSPLVSFPPFFSHFLPSTLISSPPLSFPPLSSLFLRSPLL